MLKTHEFNLGFYKKGIYSKERVINLNDFDKGTVHALLTTSIESNVTKEFVFGDMYYIKNTQEFIVFSFSFEDMNILGYGFHSISKQCLQKEFLNSSFIKFIAFNNLSKAFDFSKENVMFIGNVFVDNNNYLKEKILIAFNDIEEFIFKYSIKDSFSQLIEFYNKEDVNYTFLNKLTDEIKEFSIFENTYQSKKELFLAVKENENLFSLPITFIYFDKEYGEMEYISCQSGNIIIPINYEEFEDLIILLNKEGYTTLNLLSSINKDKVELKKGLYIKRNGYKIISLNDKSKYLELMLKYL